MDIETAFITSTYCGLPPTPADVASAWNTDWRLWLALAVLATAVRWSQQRWLFAAGWGALFVAFVSPLCALTVALLTARTVHHLVVLTVAAPLLGAACVRLGQRVSSGAALVAVMTALGLWHVPAVYSLAWQSQAWYWGLQLALLVPATVFWARIFGVLKAGHAAPSGAVLGAIAQIVVLAAVMGLTGAILTFAPAPLYLEHGLSGLAFGLQPLQDQQLAGLLMWVPGFLPLAAIAGMALGSAWKQAAPPRYHRMAAQGAKASVT